MFIDIGIENDCCEEEYKGTSENYWMSVHTSKGEYYISQIGYTTDKHKRIKISGKELKNIQKVIKEHNLSVIYGGFYWKNLEHTEHI